MASPRAFTRESQLPCSRASFSRDQDLVVAAFSFDAPPPAFIALGRIEAQLMDSDSDAEATLGLVAEELRTGCVDDAGEAAFEDFEAVEYRGNPAVLGTRKSGTTRLGYLAINNVMVSVIIDGAVEDTSPILAGFDLFLDSTIELLSEN